ncbi:pro-resilin [Lepeophtheirus salmonis]|nr:pro-resilin-like [Lepeophtheirus salmonis]
MKVLIILSALASLGSTRPQYGYNPVSYNTPRYYKYGYDVYDDYHGTKFGAYESSNGHDTTGEYHVQLPDGRLQTVNYRDDGYSGFIADVSYSGYGKHSSHAPIHNLGYGYRGGSNKYRYNPQH